MMRAFPPSIFSPHDARRLRQRGALCSPILLCALLMLLCLTQISNAAEIIPPSPSPRYVLDDAHVLSAQVADDLNRQLEQFERDTSNQIVVVLYPHMQSDDDIAAYTTRVFHTWEVGQKDKNNGVVLFIFTNDHKMQIITGYGLEGALPDILCKQIIDNEITPRFKAGDFNGGVQNGIKAMMAATKGEYKGTGRVADAPHPVRDFLSATSCFWWLLVIGFFLFIFYGQKRGWISSSPSSGVWIGGSSGGWSSGGSDWGSSDSGGGGFSGGGGDTGGGGAGGSW